MELKRRINMGEREKEKMQREKNAEPSHGGLYTTRMDESESEREREKDSAPDDGCRLSESSPQHHRTHTHIAREQSDWILSLLTILSLSLFRYGAEMGADNC
jgi:hypothetical protein